ncbi:VCBS repeat protein [Lutibacter sp. Hel_I_33_5]|uniref:VCBS repeat-containing protein n=1 Tax=Lutibacter sp. Hel_I_33_5 TaxID=1566289 RepID=UPI0011A23804|nr:VCBS repeat-containing protein [Lutibacter sp. Hel_I_33_5]TVZ56977.1 VCBS repeat protein [Lutibacter sp. Hel_I_33_5]
MQAHKNLLKYTILIVILIISCTTEESEKLDKNQRVISDTVNFTFEKVESSKSNIDFNNKITHRFTNKENLFDYDFFYNGAGVGIEDINNDGLKDIIFCGNQVSNKVYLNKGNLVFEDITEKSNINTNKNWANGITFADVNNDGWMDIYISQGGPYSKEKRENILLINQKDLTFKESAKDVGLNDAGISTQSAFFDYDNDGDLDCIVMNESQLYGYDPGTFYNLNKDEKNLKKSTSRLYENINGKFKNVTKESGTFKPTFGLGLCIADLNNDGWLDYYIANDYYVPDAMYINNKNGTFTNKIKEATKQVSFYGMGVDIADINQDNLDDIFVLDMASQDHIKSKTLMASMNVPKFNLLKSLGLHTQYMYNSLQLNIGNNKYHNIGQMLGLSKTDWSWAGLIFDTDNDGNEDIYVTNGYRRYALDNDMRIEIFKAKRKYKGNVPLKIKEEIYNKLPSEKLSNILYKGDSELNFKDNTSFSGLNEVSFSNGAAYSDLDNDGDLDIVVNNIDDKAFLFKNLTTENSKGNYIKINTKSKLSEDFAKVSISYNNKTRTKESRRVRGYLSSVDKTIHFGIGKKNTIDTVRVLWKSGNYEEKYNVQANSTLTFVETKENIKKSNSIPKIKTLFKESKTINFTHKENDFNDFFKEILLPYKQSTFGPYITKGDVNNDGLDDLFIGGAKNQSAQLYINKDNSFLKANNSSFIEDAAYEDMEAIFIDIDNDNDNDLYVVSGGSEFENNDSLLQDRIYINDGKGNFKRDKNIGIEGYHFSGKTITKIDFDNDGDQDIIVGNRIQPQKYPLHVPSFIFENVNGKYKEVTNKICPEFEDLGIINKVISTDINNDGWEDFIAVGEWTHVGIFINNNGVFKDISNKSKLDKEKGWWFSISETDVNNDGFKDYLIGNVGLNIKHKATKEKPFRIYADDFDNNGKHDVVLSYKYNNRFVPARGKECSTQQMPFISKKIPTFNQFANATLEDIYGDKVNTAYRREVNQFKSILLLNNGNSTFSKKELPKIVQSMPILDSENIDINNDGYEDLIIVGNIYNTEVETPRLDNNYALILTSNQKDNYNIITTKKSGLYTEGNAKSVKILQNKKGNPLILISLNNGKLKSYKINK